MIKRLNVQFQRRATNDDSDKIWKSSMTAEEREEAQRLAFENTGVAQNDESADFYRNQNGTTSNESPSNNQEPVSTYIAENQQDIDQYWLEYKQNWIAHNQSILDQEYRNWVKSHIDYNCAQENQEGLITDETIFMQTYPALNFYEEQYQVFLNEQYPPQTGEVD